jgi:hypothetical protein
MGVGQSNQKLCLAAQLPNFESQPPKSKKERNPKRMDTTAQNIADRNQQLQASAANQRVAVPYRHSGRDVGAMGAM